jgi:molybdate transport system substrate-binding protein
MTSNRLKDAVVCRRLLLFASLLSAQGCSTQNGAEKKVSTEKATVQSPIKLFAATGARGPSDEICDRFEKETGRKVERNYGSSGTLARQIGEGAPADIFVSANREWIDFLKDKQLLRDDRVEKIAGNTLVFIALQETLTEAPEFRNDFDIRGAIKDKIAMGDPASVPVGKYTKEVFDKLGWTDKLQDKLIMAKDVASVVRYVELGECDFGVVYRSEALQSTKVKIIKEVPAYLHSPIEFFAANLKPKDPPVKALFDAFSSRAGRESFLKFGFTDIGSDGK